VKSKKQSLLSCSSNNGENKARLSSFKHDTYIWMGGGGGVSLSSSLSRWYRGGQTI